MGEEVLSVSHHQRITTSELSYSEIEEKKWTTDDPPKSWLTSNEQ